MKAVPQIVAHRGLHAVEPENSLAAFAAAWDAGITWCECDVHLSADGVAVILHDERLERTVAGRGEIGAMTFEQLKNFRLLRGDGSVSEEFIPSLGQALAAMPAGCRMLVEVKPRIGGRIFQIAHQTEAAGGVVQSFHLPDVRLLASAGWDCAALLVENEAIEASIKRLHVNHEALDESAIAAIQARGQRVGAWTVNEPEEIERLARAEIDLMITDDPLGAREVIARL